MRHSYYLIMSFTPMVLKELQKALGSIPEEKCSAEGDTELEYVPHDGEKDHAINIQPEHQVNHKSEKCENNSASNNIYHKNSVTITISDASSVILETLQSQHAVPSEPVKKRIRRNSRENGNIHVDVQHTQPENAKWTQKTSDARSGSRGSRWSVNDLRVSNNFIFLLLSTLMCFLALITPLCDYHKQLFCQITGYHLGPIRSSNFYSFSIKYDISERLEDKQMGH